MLPRLRSGNRREDGVCREGGQDEDTVQQTGAYTMHE